MEKINIKYYWMLMVVILISFGIFICLSGFTIKINSEYNDYKSQIYSTYCKNILNGTNQNTQIDTSGLYKYPEALYYSGWFNNELNNQYICFYNPCHDLEITGYIRIDRSYVACSDFMRSYSVLTIEQYDNSKFYKLIIPTGIFLIIAIFCFVIDVYIMLYNFVFAVKEFFEDDMIKDSRYGTF